MRKIRLIDGDALDAARYTSTICGQYCCSNLCLSKIDYLDLNKQIKVIRFRMDKLKRNEKKAYLR